jgi:NAD(P)-dependent dehydrogenase (short-subunit alcohol dehydrogenase family)
VLSPTGPDGETTPRRVLVTGAARGIGYAIAERFARLGDRVVVLDRDLAPAQHAADSIGAVGAVACDLADPHQVPPTMSEAIDLLGGIDVLVNNAGVFSIVPLLEIDAAEWDRTFAINTRAMLQTTQAAARAMIAQGRGGRIVNLASMGGKVGAPGQAHYAASKAAVISLTQVASKELGEHAINVNCLCPGYVLTEMGAGTRTDEQIRSWSSLSPLGRLATPCDVASFAEFLASDGASYLTGQAFNVTGGMINH